MQCLPQFEYKDYITQGGGQKAHMVQRPRLPLFTQRAWSGCTGRLGCWREKLCSENPTMGKNE